MVRLRLRLAAHEHVEGGIVRLRPAVHRDVGLREHGYTRHAAVRREVVQMDVQKRSACHFDASSQRSLDMLEVIKPLGTEEIYDHMGASESNTIALDEEVLPVLVRYARVCSIIFLLGGA